MSAVVSACEHRRNTRLAIHALALLRYKRLLTNTALKMLSTKSALMKRETLAAGLTTWHLVVILTHALLAN